jgi:hypothetical protein
MHGAAPRPLRAAHFEQVGEVRIKGNIHAHAP